MTFNETLIKKKQVEPIFLVKYSQELTFWTNFTIWARVWSKTTTNIRTFSFIKIDKGGKNFRRHFQMCYFWENLPWDVFLASQPQIFKEGGNEKMYMFKMFVFEQFLKQHSRIGKPPCCQSDPCHLPTWQ